MTQYLKKGKEKGNIQGMKGDENTHTRHHQKKIMIGIMREDTKGLDIITGTDGLHLQEIGEETEDHILERDTILETTTKGMKATTNGLSKIDLGLQPQKISLVQIWLYSRRKSRRF